MQACARWFSHAIKDQDQTLINQKPDNSKIEMKTHLDETAQKKSAQILLFNCMSVRDPQLLLPHLLKTCADHGVYFKKAFFVPGLSVYHKVGSHAPTTTDSNVDLTWQFTLQRVWENLMIGNKGKSTIGAASEELNDLEMSARNWERSAVFSSLPLVIKWLRDSVQQNQSTRFQVLVTGSLHLVGDVLKLIKK
uniref:Folylpolyglutamate synthase n=1 Tax=Lotus japonicus TaxID=34305 RepID=I3SET1_LOTJA|nr:unknown [Lotus japonicus]